MMDKSKKTGFFNKHAKSSAAVATLVIHAVLLLVAISLVAVNVIIKDDQTFEQVKVKRPRMKLKKLTVPVTMKKKKVKPPKLRKRIVVKKEIKTVELKMPEMTGIKGGSGYLDGGGGLGSLGFGGIDLFGASRASGNELQGAFFDLKQDADGQLTDIGVKAAENSFYRGTQLEACRVIKDFISDGCPTRRFEKRYFKAPKLKYATTLMMPPMKATEAPKAFGVQNEVKPGYWMCHYNGKIAAPVSGRYRFCGIGDDILIVRVNRRTVLDASWPELIRQATSWTSDDKNNRRFLINGYKYGGFPGGQWADIYEKIDKARGFDGKDIEWGTAFRAIPNIRGESYMSAASRMVIGDWITLKKGQLVDVDIVIGEIPGGDFFCRLLIEQEGQSYPMVQSDAGPRPILPVFKTKPVENEEIVNKMELDPKEMTLAGPVFGAKINRP